MTKPWMFVAGFVGLLGVIAAMRYLRSAPPAPAPSAAHLAAVDAPRGFLARTEWRQPAALPSKHPAQETNEPGHNTEDPIRVPALPLAESQAPGLAKGADKNPRARSGSELSYGQPSQNDPDVVFSTDDEKQYGTDKEVELSKTADISPEAGTLAFWLKPQWEAGSEDDASFVDIGNGGLRVSKHRNLLHFDYVDATGATGGVSVPIESWAPDEWHYVATAWTNNQLEVYIDGRLQFRVPHESPFDLLPDSKVYLGSNSPAAAPGMLDRIDARNRVLSPAEIAGQFQRGQPPDN